MTTCRIMLVLVISLAVQGGELLCVPGVVFALDDHGMHEARYDAAMCVETSNQETDSRMASVQSEKDILLAQTEGHTRVVVANGNGFSPSQEEACQRAIQFAVQSACTYQERAVDYYPGQCGCSGGTPGLVYNCSVTVKVYCGR